MEYNNCSEIGSEFWIDQKPSELIKGFPSWLEFKSNNLYTALGRNALSFILNSIEGVVEKKSVLLPYYICNSVISPFIHKGYKCLFYSVNPDLSPNLSTIDVDVNEAIGVFLHLGYFGFPSNQNLGETVRKLKEKGTIIIEDISHTLFSNYNRFSENDYYFASVRKWFGIPSGGYMSTDYFVNPQKSLPLNMTYIALREQAMQIKGEYIITKKWELKPKYLSLFGQAEEKMAKDNDIYTIDSISETIINKVDINRLKQVRRENYNKLLFEIEGLESIKPIFSYLESNVTPLFFPVIIPIQRDKVRERLKESKIYCPIHWPISKNLYLSAYTNSPNVFDTILSIPCDQRYSIEDMARIASTLKSCLK